MVTCQPIRIPVLSVSLRHIYIISQLYNLVNAF
nr:MAG TPA: hypothetical protein [Bacteriophage sp.]